MRRVSSSTAQAPVYAAEYCRSACARHRRYVAGEALQACPGEPRERSAFDPVGRDSDDEPELSTTRAAYAAAGAPSDRNCARRRRRRSHRAHAGAACSSAAPMLAAVSSARVAWTSTGATDPWPARSVSSHSRVEELAARRLRRQRGEDMASSSKPPSNVASTTPRCSPSPLSIVGPRLRWRRIQRSSNVLPGPVSKPVGRSRRVEHRNVCDTADVHDDAPLARASEPPCMKRGDERRALAAERDVQPAEVGNGRDARHGRDHVRIADLQTERLAARRLVEDRLPVAVRSRRLSRPLFRARR